MDSVSIILIIIAAVAVVFGGIYFVLPAAIKKGVDISGTIEIAQKVTSTASVIVEALEKALPESKALNVVKNIIEYSDKGVAAAEQMWTTSQIEAAERKGEATKLTYEMLELAGITIDDKVKDVVNGVIEAAVFVTPHSKKNAEPPK